MDFTPVSPLFPPSDDDDDDDDDDAGGGARGGLGAGGGIGGGGAAGDDLLYDDDDDNDDDEEDEEPEGDEDDEEEGLEEKDFVTPAKQTGKSKPRPTRSGDSTGSDAKFKATTLIGDGAPIFPGSGILSYKEGISFRLN
jgi:hypothetical protein